MYKGKQVCCSFVSFPASVVPSFSHPLAMHCTSATLILLLAGWSAAGPISSIAGDVITKTIVTTSKSCDNVLASPTPAQLICGQIGNVANPKSAVISTEVVSSQDDCLPVCLNQLDNCLTFSYQASTKTCTYYSATIKSLNFKASANTGLIWYNNNCTSCTCLPETLRLTVSHRFQL